MDEDIRVAYMNWLYDLIFSVRDLDDPRSYVALSVLFHSVPFNDSVPNDSNRASDGVQLREEFVSTFSGMEVEDYAQIYGLGKASIFEVLIALARKAEFNFDGDAREWMMIFLRNLGLDKYPDADYIPRHSFRILRIITNMNDRRYSSSGKGGLFPLRNPEKDQRQVEIWYQMAAFMIENQMY